MNTLKTILTEIFSKSKPVFGSVNSLLFSEINYVLLMPSANICSLFLVGFRMSRVILFHLFEYFNPIFPITLRTPNSIIFSALLKSTSLITKYTKSFNIMFSFRSKTVSTFIMSNLRPYTNRKCVMVGSVFTIAHYLKVLYSVIVFNMVLVVNKLAWFKFSTKKFLHNISVFKNSHAVNYNALIFHIMPPIGNSIGR